jgi:hypothetical protein
VLAVRLLGRVFAGATATLRLDHGGRELRATVPGTALAGIGPGAALRLAIPPDRAVALEG